MDAVVEIFATREDAEHAAGTLEQAGVEAEPDQRAPFLESAMLNATQLIPGLGTVMALGTAGAVVLGAVGAAVGKAFDGVPSPCTWKRSGEAGAW